MGLKPATGQLKGFTWHIMWPLRTIHLPFILVSYDKTRRKTNLIDFVLIWHPVEHNIILGWTALPKFEAISSIMHRVVKFNTTEGSGTILATPSKERWCYEIMQLKEITQEAKRSWGDSASGKEVINKEHLDQSDNIGVSLPSPTKTSVDQPSKEIQACHRLDFHWHGRGRQGNYGTQAHDKTLNKVCKAKNVSKEGGGTRTRRSTSKSLSWPRREYSKKQSSRPRLWTQS